MSYLREAREITQNRYGYYCNMCREMKTVILPYVEFSNNEEVYKQTKKDYKSWKNKQ